MLREKKVCGVITVEMSYLMPIILMIFLAVIYTIFYYHDKNILIGAAAETVVVGAQAERNPEKKDSIDLEAFCRERIGGKNILFSEVSISAATDRQYVSVQISAQKGRMRMEIDERAMLAEPERKIRRKKAVEEWIGDEE